MDKKNAAWNNNGKLNRHYFEVKLLVNINNTQNLKQMNVRLG